MPKHRCARCRFPRPAADEPPAAGRTRSRAGPRAGTRCRGGLELKAFAEAQPGWQLLGVDPAAPMLALAEQTLGPLNARVELLEGYIDDAPDVRFDGASCLLTLHFLDAAQRLHSCASCTGACSPARRWWWPTTACRRIRTASCAGCSATPRSPKPRCCPRRCTARDRRHCRATATAGARTGSGAAAGGRLRRRGAVLCRLQLQGLGGVRRVKPTAPR